MKPRSLVKLTLLSLVLAVLGSSPALAAGKCKDTPLKDFKTEVKGKADADKLFQKYIEEEKLGAFDATKVSFHDCGVKPSCFTYNDWSAPNEKLADLQLFPDGRLVKVKRGKCK
jgi:hypothetical protein